ACDGNPPTGRTLDVGVHAGKWRFHGPVLLWQANGRSRVQTIVPPAIAPEQAAARAIFGLPCSKPPPEAAEPEVARPGAEACRRSRRLRCPGEGAIFAAGLLSGRHFPCNTASASARSAFSSSSRSAGNSRCPSHHFTACSKQSLALPVSP